MRCPQCKSDNTRVVNSRERDDGFTVRRSRECKACLHRFPTHERAYDEIEELRRRLRILYDAQKLSATTSVPVVTLIDQILARRSD